MEIDFSALTGKTLVSIAVSANDDEMTFRCADGTSYRLYHVQDCCESVAISEIHGDLADLVGSEILFAEESANSHNPPALVDSHTWTFYRLTTIKGSVVIRWLGESNGYYSESVDFAQIEPS